MNNKAFISIQPDPGSPSQVSYNFQLIGPDDSNIGHGENTLTISNSDNVHSVQDGIVDHLKTVFSLDFVAEFF